MFQTTKQNTMIVIIMVLTVITLQLSNSLEDS